MEKSRNLGIVEPNYIVLASIKSAFRDSDLNVAVECRSLEEILNLDNPSARLDALLIDVEERAYPSVPDVTRLRSEFPGIRIILLANTAELADVGYALRHDIDGLVLKTSRPEVVRTSVELALLGERVFPADASFRVYAASEDLSRARSVNAKVISELTRREIEVLKDLSQGRANKEIARNLDLSESTVKVHVKAILRKSQTRNRTEAALWAKEIGLAE